MQLDIPQHSWGKRIANCIAQACIALWMARCRRPKSCIGNDYLRCLDEWDDFFPTKGILDQHPAQSRLVDCQLLLFRYRIFCYMYGIGFSTSDQSALHCMASHWTEYTEVKSLYFDLKC